MKRKSTKTVMSEVRPKREKKPKQEKRPKSANALRGKYGSKL